MSESALLKSILISASKIGLRLFRNNVGTLRDARGGYVAYGLGVGTSDLIGWTPVTITPELVGRTLAVFTAVETKYGKRTTTSEQRAFLDAVSNAGGIACVARAEADVEDAAKRFDV